MLDSVPQFLPQVLSLTRESAHVLQCRYEAAPDFRRLALLESLAGIVRTNGPRCLQACVDVCLPMLLHGVSSLDTSVANSATDLFLVS